MSHRLANLTSSTVTLHHDNAVVGHACGSDERAVPVGLDLAGALAPNRVEVDIRKLALVVDLEDGKRVRLLRISDVGVEVWDGEGVVQAVGDGDISTFRDDYFTCQGPTRSSLVTKGADLTYLGHAHAVLTIVGDIEGGDVVSQLTYHMEERVSSNGLEDTMARSRARLEVHVIELCEQEGSVVEAEDMQGVSTEVRGHHEIASRIEDDLVEVRCTLTLLIWARDWFPRGHIEPALKDSIILYGVHSDACGTGRASIR